MSKIYTLTSIGELIDKITILEIKKDNIKDTSKLKEVNKELDALVAIERDLKNVDDLDLFYVKTELKQKLREINAKLWGIEDSIRKKEKNKAFDSEFIKLARLVYLTNDQRFKVKNEINELFGSEIKEQKQYTNYQK